MNENTIGERLRELRKSNSMTQDDLANALGVSRVQVNQWESGSREISNSRIIKIAEFFGTTCDYILLGKETHDISEFGNISSTGNEINEILSDSSIQALRDIRKIDAESRKTYKDILNGLIGSNAFWNRLMPSAAAAYTMRKQSSAEGIPISSLPNEMIRYEINDAADSFKKILTATIEHKAIPEELKDAEWTEEYNSSIKLNDTASEFKKFFKQFGIKLN